MFCALIPFYPLPETMNQDDISFPNISLVNRAENHRFKWPNTALSRSDMQAADVRASCTEPSCQLVVSSPDLMAGEQKAKQTLLNPFLSKPSIFPYKLGDWMYL